VQAALVPALQQAATQAGEAASLSAQVAVLFPVWSSPSLAVDPLTVRKSRPAAHPQFRQVAVKETLRELPNVLDRGLQKLSTSLPAAVSAQLVRAAALAARFPLRAARCPMPDARRPNAKFLQNSYPGSAGLRRVAKGATTLRHPRAHPSEALSCGSGWETREGEFLRPRVVMPLCWPAGALVRSTQLPAPRMPRQGPALGSSITEAFKQAFGSTLLPGYERASLLVKRRLLRQRLLAPPGGCGGSDAPTHPIAPGAA
jgi:hypothetical protein